MAAGASLLYSKLDAVNECLEVLGQQPFSALTSTSNWPSKSYASDIVSQVERILDRTTVEVLKQGFEFNTIGPITVTPSGGAITIATNSAFNDLYVIRVIPEGRNKRRPMALRGNGTVYNPQTGSSSDWTEFSTYDLTLIVAYEFQNCDIDAQILIMRETIKKLTETRLGDELKRKYAVESAAKADIQASRPWPSKSSNPINSGPVLTALGGNGQNQ